MITPISPNTAAATPPTVTRDQGPEETCKPPCTGVNKAGGAGPSLLDPDRQRAVQATGVVGGPARGPFARRVAPAARRRRPRPAGRRRTAAAPAPTGPEDDPLARECPGDDPGEEDSQHDPDQHAHRRGDHALVADQGSRLPAGHAHRPEPPQFPGALVDRERQRVGDPQQRHQHAPGQERVEQDQDAVDAAADLVLELLLGAGHDPRVGGQRRPQGGRRGAAIRPGVQVRAVSCSTITPPGARSSSVDCDPSTQSKLYTCPIVVGSMPVAERPPVPLSRAVALFRLETPATSGTTATARALAAGIGELPSWFSIVKSPMKVRPMMWAADARSPLA